MSISASEVKHSLRKTDFPFCAREALERIEKLCVASETNQSSHSSKPHHHSTNMELAKDLMAEFVFCEIDRRGGRRRKLGCIQELQLLEALCDFFKPSYTSGNSDTTRNSVFMALFPPSVAERSRLLVKLVSMAISTKNVPVLAATGRKYRRGSKEDREENRRGSKEDREENRKGSKEDGEENRRGSKENRRGSKENRRGSKEDREENRRGSEEDGEENRRGSKEDREENRRGSKENRRGCKEDREENRRGSEEDGEENRRGSKEDGEEIQERKQGRQGRKTGEEARKTGEENRRGKVRHHLNLAEGLVKDYFVLVPKAVSGLQDLPQLAPHFTANFLTSVAEMYTSGDKRQVLTPPPNTLLEVVTQWVSDNPPLCLAALLNKTATAVTTPFVGLFKWCILSPLYYCGRTSSTEHSTLYSRLHLALLESLVRCGKPLAANGKTVISVQHVVSIVDPLIRWYKEVDKLPDGSKAVELALDRLAQAVQIGLFTGCIAGDKEELLKMLDMLPEHRVLKLVIKKQRELLTQNMDILEDDVIIVSDTSQSRMVIMSPDLPRLASQASLKLDKWVRQNARSNPVNVGISMNIKGCYEARLKANWEAAQIPIIYSNTANMPGRLVVSRLRHNWSGLCVTPTS
uniref:Uncharacterized protein n=1 Tax=Timema tahoe TaxID=61484 RepID=A0A7R9IPC1_9NEOP|nr:unnamed protein product [Timema tahoe]